MHKVSIQGAHRAHEKNRHPLSHSALPCYLLVPSLHFFFFFFLSALSKMTR